MPVFFTLLTTRIWWRACNQAVAPRTTRQTYLHAPGCYDYRSDV